jgi:FlaA1/EpsC-like NDP-sugar epimerase
MARREVDNRVVAEDLEEDALASRSWLRHTATWRFLARHRLWVQACIDSFAWAVALSTATVFRYDFDFREVHPRGLAIIVSLAILLQLAAGSAGGLYLARWRFGSFEEVAALARSTLLVTVGALVANRVVFDTLIPTSATLGGGLFALVIMGGARYLWRLSMERRLRPRADAEPVVVFGAGEGGEQVVTAMMRNPVSPYVPVALLDDAPSKQHLRLKGVPVVGTRADLGTMAEQGVKTLVVAIPSATASLLREISELAEAASMTVRVLPPVSELFGAPIGVSDIRPLTEADLLGRHEVDTDVDAIAGYLTGRRVMVTGAGGSIGSELCRQIYRFAPAELVMVERDESALHAVQLSIEGRALLDSRNLVVCDIRDELRVREVFKEHRPHVVFHAAALKHLPLLQMFPAEAVKTNVWATQTLLDVAAEFGVERFVNISTDKAADPISVLGFTKRLAERLTADAAARTGRPYLSVRFGNVLGSRGSVLTAFRTQIAAGGPVTVTDRAVSRFFMTVEEAVQLVIQAGAIGRAGEVLVLDMGDPVRIDDVARLLVGQADRQVDIIYTGLRPGEKLHEVLLGHEEADVRPVHPLLAQVPVPAVAGARARAIDVHASADSLIEELRWLCQLPARAVERSEKD